MNPSPKTTDLTRRDFLLSTVGGTLLLPTISTLAANAISANDKIQLGVIGIGPRCRYVLSGMLKSADMRCMAIADVQASRRDAARPWSMGSIRTPIANCIATSVNCSLARILMPS